MVALLDINVLIALLDGDHLFHAVATQWLTDITAARPPYVLCKAVRIWLVFTI